jgi:uncharacterized protein YjbI with pentapeptide repeats
MGNAEHQRVARFFRSIATVTRRREVRCAVIAFIVIAAITIILLFLYPAWALSLLIGAVVVFLASYLLLIWPMAVVAQLGLAKPKEIFERKNEVRKTAIQFLGILVILSVPATLYLSWENLSATQQNAIRTQQITLQGQIADRFSRAVAQLGDNKAAVRVGGINTLGSIAKENPGDHRTVMELLLAYLREGREWNFLDDMTKLDELPGLCNECRDKHFGEDRQAVLAILGHRKVENESGQDWHFELRGLDIGCGHLEKANLDEATLYNVNLRRASLIQAHLQRASVSNVDFDGAGLNGAWLNGTTLARVRLREAQLVGAQLVGADLRDDVDLRSANLDHADLNDIHLDNADLRGARWTNTCWGAATLTRALLDGADLSGADLLRVQGLTWEQLEKATWDNRTRLNPKLQQVAIEKDKQRGSTITQCEKGLPPPSSLPIYEGYYDTTSCDGVFGWAWDMTQPNEPIEVDIYDDDALFTKLKADLFRQDILDAGRGNGKHGIFFRPHKTGSHICFG